MIPKPRCIRIFFNQADAEFARDVLNEAGIESYVTEDGFGKLKLPDLGMRPRFRLYIDQDDINKAGQYLAKRLRNIKSVENE